MSLSPGTLLQGGKYRIVRFISAGGFGCTYEAVHTSLNGRIAIKEFFVSDICNRDEATGYVSVGLQSKVATFDKLREKFIREAQSVFALSHPGIVHVSDVFEENGTAYFVMDYIDGYSLDDMVSKYGAMSEANALDFMRQVCDALAYVHANNRLHLDIKPGNIMVDQNGRAILIDFGASKQYDTGRGENLSTLLGFTPGFAPPEQMTADVSRFLPATDIYAVAATLYNLLTGAAPLSANQRSAGDENEPLPASVSESTRRAINAALQLNKSARPQTVTDFSAMLFGGSAAAPSAAPRRAAESLSRDTERFPSRPTERKPAPTSSPTPSSNKTTNTGSKSATKSRTPLYVAIVAIVAILTFGVIYLLPKGGETVAPTENDFDDAALVDSVEVCDSIPVKDAEPQQQPAPAEAPTQQTEPAKAETPTQQTEPAKAETPTPKGHAACNHLDLYTTYQGKARFFTVDEWNAVPASERGAYTKKGVVVKCNGVSAFSLALHDSGEGMTWDEAVRRYGEAALPSEAQCDAMKSDYAAINKAITAFGGDKNPELWYWGKSETASTAWLVTMTYGNVTSSTKTYTCRVRSVATIPGFSTSSNDGTSTKPAVAERGHAACNHLDLYTTYQGKTRFFTVREWNAVPASERSAYTKKGVIVKCNGVPAFSLALHDSGEDMTWDEAVRRYGKSALPSEAQCRAMQSDYKAINKAITAFGGDKVPSCWYWGKSYDASAAWYVNLYYGYVSIYNKAHTYRVRSVARVAESAK